MKRVAAVIFFVLTAAFVIGVSFYYATASLRYEPATEPSKAQPYAALRSDDQTKLPEVQSRLMPELTESSRDPSPLLPASDSTSDSEPTLTVDATAPDEAVSFSDQEIAAASSVNDDLAPIYDSEPDYEEIAIPEVTPGYRLDITPVPTTVPSPLPTSETALVPVYAAYVLNHNTMKFHKPSCSSVDTIKEENKGYYEGTREELIALGYSPCGRCHP